MKLNLKKYIILLVALIAISAFQLVEAKTYSSQKSCESSEGTKCEPGGIRGTWLSKSGGGSSSSSYTSTCTSLPTGSSYEAIMECAAKDSVTRAYEECLGRSPDSEGYDFHMNLITSGQKSGDQIYNDICNSEEAKNKDESGAEDGSASNQFLWKPTSDSDGKLVVLLPNSMRGDVTSAAVTRGMQTIDIGKFSGDEHNGMRPHFRFPKKGSEYGTNVQLVAMTSSGACSWTIPNGAERFEAGEGNCGPDAGLMGGMFGVGGPGGFIYDPNGGVGETSIESQPEYCLYGESTNPPSKNIKVMMMGDSNTVGVGNPGTTDQINVIGYRKYLKDTLVAAKFTVDFVGSQCNGSSFMSDCQHEGYSGMGIAKLQSRVSAGAIKTYKPDVVTILVGSNDMWVSLSNRSPISDSLANTRVSDLGKLIDSIHKDAPSALVIVAKPATPNTATRPLGIYRNGIDTLATTRSYVKVVDFSGFSNDGTHYKPAGFEKIAAAFAGKIKEFRSSCNKAPIVSNTGTNSTTTTSTSTSTVSASNELVIDCRISDTSIEVGEDTEISVKISGGDSPYEIRWSGDTSKIQKISKTKNDQDIEFKKAGKYVLEVKVTDDAGKEVEEICSAINVYEKDAEPEEEAVNSTDYTTPTYTAPTVSFYRDLTVGSEGADVTALQEYLIARGFLTMPAGVAKGYFGELTRSAVARWQSSVGLTPAAGYFGQKSRTYIATGVIPASATPTYVAPAQTVTTPKPAVSAASCVNVTKTLNYQESSADVAKVQTFLEMKGYLTMPEGAAKGTYGKLTATAIANYMASKNISTSGVIADESVLSQIRKDTGCAN